MSNGFRVKVIGARIESEYEIEGKPAPCYIPGYETKIIITLKNIGDEFPGAILGIEEYNPIAAANVEKYEIPSLKKEEVIEITHEVTKKASTIDRFALNLFELNKQSKIPLDGRTIFKLFPTDALSAQANLKTSKILFLTKWIFFVTVLGVLIGLIGLLKTCSC